MENAVPYPSGRVRNLQSQTRTQLNALLSRRQQIEWPVLYGSTFDFTTMKQRACRAPELHDAEAWIHSEPLTLDDLKGKVVIVHFYTYICINCVRNLPHYNRWHADFPADRLQIIGIHRPEFQHDRQLAKIEQAAKEAGITYPIAVDNASKNWDTWGNQVWPSVYLIDKQGFIRYWWYGELNWQGTPGEQQMRHRIQALLAE
ncbi:redoxin domain-containing protein [Planctomycetota bacterium]